MTVALNRWRATTREDTSTTLFDRVVGANGIDITASSLSALSLKVFVARTRVQVGDEMILSPISSYVFDTLHDSTDDPRYPSDGGGFNFAVEVPGSYFPDGDETYVVEIYFSDRSAPAKVFCDPWEITAREVIGF